MLTDAEANKAYDYMNRAEFIDGEFVSPTLDPLDNSITIPAVTMCDGVFTWSSIILHWVKTYKVRLPQNFMDWINMTQSERDKYDRIPIEEIHEHKKNATNTYIKLNESFI